MSILEKICADKRIHVESRKKELPLSELREKTQRPDAPFAFEKALRQTSEKGKPAFICEVKKASPSKGVISEDFDPVRQARVYQNAGTSCISVLTDTPYFMGSDTDFKNVRKAVSCPLIRKDFMVDLYQIYESRYLGADCVLLIMASLDDGLAKEMRSLAEELGMSTLIEVHNRKELERAHTLSPRLIGVNSRNLKTMKVDVDATISMAADIKDGILPIAESGIKTPSDVSALYKGGYRGFLIGESLMRSKDASQSIKALENISI